MGLVSFVHPDHPKGLQFDATEPEVHAFAERVRGDPTFVADSRAGGVTVFNCAHIATIKGRPSQGTVTVTFTNGGTWRGTDMPADIATDLTLAVKNGMVAAGLEVD